MKYSCKKVHNNHKNNNIMSAQHRKSRPQFSRRRKERKIGSKNRSDAPSPSVFVSRIYWPQCATRSLPNAQRGKKIQYQNRNVFSLAITFIAYAAHRCLVLGEKKGKNW